MRKKSFSYVWRVVTLAILASPLTALSPAEAVPAGVPNQPCGTLRNPSPGTLCYTVTPGGGKASAGGSSQEFSTIIQATEAEYVIASVVVEVTSAAGERNGPTVNQISPGGTASIVTVATNKLRELKQIKGELQAKATVLSGPALIEAQAKLTSLSEQERTFEEVVTKTTAAGQDAGKFQVTGSARPRRCGTFNADKCGSWIEYNIYVVRRYVGNPIAAYNRAFAVAQDAKNTINRLIASQPSQPSPQRFGAIARSDSTGKRGWAWGFETPQKAESGAIQSCGSSDCKSMWFRDNFGALAEADDNAWAAMWGSSREEAEQNALQNCQKNSRRPETCKAVLLVNSITGIIYQR